MAVDRDKFVKILSAVLILFIIQLQYRLWLGDGSRQEVWAYQEQLETLVKKVKANKQRNDALYAEVIDLGQGFEAIEERARYELGMIKEGETFFQIIE